MRIAVHWLAAAAAAAVFVVVSFFVDLRQPPQPSIRSPPRGSATVECSDVIFRPNLL